MCFIVSKATLDNGIDANVATSWTPVFWQFQGTKTHFLSCNGLKRYES